MSGIGMNFTQNQQMNQQLHLSPQMLQSLDYLMMNHSDLMEVLYEEEQKNPALEIARYPTDDVAKVSPRTKTTTQEDRPRKQASSTSADDFQQFIENQRDSSESIQEHLLTQFRLTTNDTTKINLAERLLSFLDEHGFIQIAPVSVIDRKNSLETVPLLEEVLATIQRLEPVGCCTSGSQESIYVQASDVLEGQEEFSGKEWKELALFLLAGNLFLLEKMRLPVILKKLKEKQEEQAVSKSLPPPESIHSWTRQPKNHQLPKKITESMVEQSLHFIKSLDPLPARQFSSLQGIYISPEITVDKVLDETGWKFTVNVNNNLLPEVKLSPSYRSVGENSAGLSKEEKKFLKTSIKDAQALIQSLDFRRNTLENAARAIVELQKDFFLYGPKYLRPLKMKEVAERIQVHEATVSRLASNKYLRCQWGVFEIRFFFSNEIQTLASPESPQQKKNQQKNTDTEEKLSKEGVKFILKEILEEHKAAAGGGRPLSDQKLTDILVQRGIKIARRTVAKYRTELNIDSSFNRQ